MGQKAIVLQHEMAGVERVPYYCCDASALIDLQHANLLKKLTPLLRDGCLRIPEGVFRELRRRSDKLERLLDTWDSKYTVVVRLNELEKTKLSIIEQTYGKEFRIGSITYPGFWRSASGKKAADGQVVAVAKIRGWIVVSGDKSVKGACARENVECISWEDFGRRLGIIGFL
jgi:hypothetical protein